MHPTENGTLAHAEMVALGEGHRAGGTREAAHVEDELAGAHYELRGEDRRLAARAALHTAEHPADRLRVWLGWLTDWRG